jgi:hypothetical protein
MPDHRPAGFRAYRYRLRAQRLDCGEQVAEAVSRQLQIASTLVDLLAPVWLRIGAYFYPRGGMPIDVFWQTGAPPQGVWVPDQGVPPYRGRG